MDRTLIKKGTYLTGGVAPVPAIVGQLRTSAEPGKPTLEGIAQKIAAARRRIDDIAASLRR